MCYQYTVKIPRAKNSWTAVTLRKSQSGRINTLQSGLGGYSLINVQRAYGALSLS